METSDTLYKYRTWSDKNHQSCLKNNELFFASPSDINDPFDFKISLDYRLLDTDEKKEQYIDKLLNDIKRVMKKDIDFEVERRELINRLKNDPGQMEREYQASNSKAMDLKSGVISLSERWDSILMWTHYAEGHKGFCIGLNRKKLQKSDFFGVFGPVKYSDDFPKIDPLNTDIFGTAMIQTHTKAKEWSYEKEIRLSQIWPDRIPSIQDRLVHFPTDFITEIILGLNIPLTHQQEIVEISQRKGISVFKVEKARQSFSIHKVPL